MDWAVDSSVIDARGAVTAQGQPLMALTSAVTGGIEPVGNSGEKTFALRLRSDGGLIESFWVHDDDAGVTAAYDSRPEPLVGDDVALVPFYLPFTGWYSRVSTTWVHGTDLRSGQTLFEVGLGERWLASRAFTTRRSIIFDAYSPDGGQDLEELDVSGRAAFTCPFRASSPVDASPMYDAAVLTPQRWVRMSHLLDGGTALEAYAVPGVNPAPVNGGRSVPR
jgi:hypothetical protein